MTAEQKLEKFLVFTKKFNEANKTSPRSRKPNQFFHLAYARFEAEYIGKVFNNLTLTLKRNKEEAEDEKPTQFLTFALSYECDFHMEITTDSFGDLYAKHTPTGTLFPIWESDIISFREGREVTLYAMFLDDKEKEVDLKKVVQADIEYLNRRLKEGPNALLLPPYYSFHEYENSELTGLYGLYCNFHELWYGTLREINAIIKAFIKKDEIDEKDD